MKVLIVGGNKSWWAIERYYIHHLEELGAEVQVFASPDIIFDYHSKNIFNKILFKSKIRTGYASTSAGLIEKAESFKPDVIMVFKGMEIYPSALEKLRKKFILTNYNPDHPFIIKSVGGGNKNVTNSVGLYHLHFCYNSLLQREIEEKFHLPTVFLPFGYELSEKDYLIAETGPELPKVCFIGNPDNTRKTIIEEIASSGFPVDVYGHEWQKTGLRRSENIKICNAVNGLDFWKMIRSYRVQLNIFREHNLGSHNMRTFEIPAVGGIQMAPYSEEHVSFFEDGKEIFLYKNQDDILAHLKNLINAPVEKASEIRRAARARSVNSHYTYRDRAITVYNTFQKLIANG
jgi:spore maturation protein CgeB